ncbi:MAG TPA: hypothetical protein VHL34_02100 [Rhizomicrobium sp.]|nr:hypothetical protein [Rhizomicrobium sp.]
MLTKADDYPIHQLPEPIATSGTDRNFYDRFFFNGYTADGATFFSAALGVYPHLNVMDAAFSIVQDGTQSNLHASKNLKMERMDTTVGPIKVEVIEPLHMLRVTVGDNAHGIKADLTFTSRAKAVEEPRFTFRNGPRTFMDYTRLTQNGSWSGWIEVNGKKTTIESTTMGTRDRSWGIRPIGQGDPQPLVPARAPQFYWLWAPMNFPERFMLYHNNANADGASWNTASVIGNVGDGEPAHMEKCGADIDYKSGTRHATRAVITVTDAEGGEWQAEMKPKYNFYMMGIGYGHPEWGHGHWKGENELGFDSFKTAEVNENMPHFQHIQAVSEVTLTGPNGIKETGIGVLEQLAIGEYKPHGLTGIFDPHK